MTPTTGHLVIDSGSSGTRFCVFDVTRDAATKKCSIGATTAICAKSSGGLAALTDGKDPKDVPALVTPNLDQAWTGLDQAFVAAGKDLGELEKVKLAAALGTGGYRDPATAAPAMNPAWDAVWTTIDTFLKGKGLTEVVAKAIPGQDEANLAWVGVNEAVAPGKPFAILETGGATLQLAGGTPGDAYDMLLGGSVYRGQNYEFFQLSADPAFSVCYSPMDRTMQDGASCTAYLAEKVFKDNGLESLAAMIGPRELYGLGAPWSGLLREFPNAPPWTPKTDDAFNAELTLENLKALAVKVCPLQDADVLSFAPNSFDANSMSGKLCYSVSFHAAYLDAFKGVANMPSIQAGGDDQWARGASVTSKFFSDCE
jgi:hypothetical protein